jgi:hypothetical protein
MYNMNITKIIRTSIIQISKYFQRRMFFLNPANQKQEFPMVTMFVFQSGPNEET